MSIAVINAIGLYFIGGSILATRVVRSLNPDGNVELIAATILGLMAGIVWPAILVLWLIGKLVTK